MNPVDKRLAIAVEDHTLEYIDFEGIIPVDQYGAGAVVIWDNGTYKLVQATEDRVIFVLEGKKLKGDFTLTLLKGRGKAKSGSDQEGRICGFPVEDCGDARLKSVLNWWSGFLPVRLHDDLFSYLIWEACFPNTPSMPPRCSEKPDLPRGWHSEGRPLLQGLHRPRSRCR
jgi:hypothetical protein